MQKIAPAFIKAKKAFSPALKEKTNPAFRSKYADLGACLEAVNDAFLDNGIAVYQETFDDATGVTVETVLLHESGEALRCGKLHVPASKQDAQGYGSALTYARRYSLLTACGIAPEDDDGNAATKAIKVSPTKSDAVISPNRQAVLNDVKDAISDRFTKSDIIGAYDEYMGITDQEEKIALWSLLDSKTRSALKAHGESLKQQKA